MWVVWDLVILSKKPQHCSFFFFANSVVFPISLGQPSSDEMLITKCVTGYEKEQGQKTGRQIGGSSNMVALDLPII